MNYNTWMPSYGQPQPAWQPTRPDMTQGYPQQQMQPVQAQGQPQGFFVRPVTNREEAVAAQIDFLSPGTLMPDFGNGRVYFKRFNSQTGSCDFLTFVLQRPDQAEAQPQATAEYATKADLQEIQSVVQGLADELKNMRGGKRLVDESV